MSGEKLISHKDFIDKYKSGQLIVRVNKNMVGDLVMSPLADVHNKPAHLFWSWGGLILAIPVTLVLIFVNWVYALISLIVGFLIINAAKESATQFVLQNMLEDEDFWVYVLAQGGALIDDKDGGIYLAKGFSKG